MSFEFETEDCFRCVICGSIMEDGEESMPHGGCKRCEKPCKGDIAFCSLGCLGLITEDEPQRVFYADGNDGMAYVGIHITDKVAPIGARWSSRNPIVVGHIDDFKNPMKI
jgi:hypothetical protein